MELSSVGVQSEAWDGGGVGAGTSPSICTASEYLYGLQRGVVGGDVYAGVVPEILVLLKRHILRIFLRLSWLNKLELLQRHKELVRKADVVVGGGMRANTNKAKCRGWNCLSINTMTFSWTHDLPRYLLASCAVCSVHLQYVVPLTTGYNEWHHVLKVRI